MAERTYIQHLKQVENYVLHLSEQKTTRRHDHGRPQGGARGTFAPLPPPRKIKNE